MPGFASGYTYVYEYDARLQTGIPKLSTQSSDIEIKAEMQVQAGSDDEVALKLVNVRTRQLDGSGAEAHQPREATQELRKQLEKPISFQQEDGRVTGFHADRSEPEWSLNLKKAILSLFHVDLKPKNVVRQSVAIQQNMIPLPSVFEQQEQTYYAVLEEGLGGECETTYEWNQIASEDTASADQLLNLTKTRDYERCTRRSLLSKDNFGLKHNKQWKSTHSILGDIVTADKNQKQEIVKQYSTVKYNISQTEEVAIIESILAEGRIVYNTFGDKIVAMTRQNVTLKTREEKQVIETQGRATYTKHEELTFQLPNAGREPRIDIMSIYNQDGRSSEVTRKMPQYFKTLAQQVLSKESADSKDAMQLVIQIVNALSSLPRDALDKLFKEVAEPARRASATQHQQVMRQLLLDCLPLAGTNEAAIVIKYQDCFQPTLCQRGSPATGGSSPQHVPPGYQDHRCIR